MMLVLYYCDDFYLEYVNYCCIVFFFCNQMHKQNILGQTSRYITLIKKSSNVLYTLFLSTYLP